MKNKKTLKELLIAAISLAPLIYYLYLWNSLAESIPIHFDAQGNPDNYGSKYLFGLILLIVTLGIYLFLKFVPRIYRKNSFTFAPETFTKLRLMLALFFSALYLIIIISVQNGEINNILVCITIALLFSILGNYMGNVRPNYQLGNRFLWTKTDESSWKKTHKFIGKLWFFSGLALALLLIFIPANYALYVLFISLAFLILIIPSAYSLMLKSKHKSKETSSDGGQIKTDSHSDHWVGLFYFNRNDKRVLVPKRVPGMGWTLNFANPYSIIVIIIIILLIVFTYLLK